METRIEPFTANKAIHHTAKINLKKTNLFTLKYFANRPLDNSLMTSTSREMLADSTVSTCINTNSNDLPHK